MNIILKKQLWFSFITTPCLVFVVLFAATGCYKHENPSEYGLYLYAKVENAAKYSNVVAVKLTMRNRVLFEDVELARGDWKDGGFTILLPKIDRNRYREFIHFRFLPLTIIENLLTITTSNKDARIGIAEFWGVDKDDKVVTRFRPVNMYEDNNTSITYVGYVNSDVNISGYIDVDEIVIIREWDEYLNADILYTWKNYTIYSYELKEGWNFLCWSNFNSLPGEKTETVSTISISKLKWYGDESSLELD